MTPDGQTSAQLAVFAPALAEAVVTVLQRHGISSAVEPLDHEDVEVRVPAARRDEALALLADHMEQIHELVGRAGTVTATPVPVTDPQAHEEDEGTGAPIVMDRLRRMSLGLVVLLAPLLVITLAGVNLPIGYALALFVGGLVAVVYWRSRDEP